jgi:hypothetical protein
MDTQGKTDWITDGTPPPVRSRRTNVEIPMPCSRLSLAGAYLILIAGIVLATLLTADGANLF